MMLDDSPRDVKAFPSGPAGAKAQIAIFAIEEKAAVKSADGVQHGPAIKRRRAARKQGLFGHREILRPSKMAALFGRSIGTDQHSGRIKALLAIKAHLRCAHAGIRPLRNSRDKRFEPAGVRDCIIVQSGDKWGSGGADGLVYGCAEALVARVF